MARGQTKQKMEEQEIDYLNHFYEPQQQVLINGNSIVAICKFLAEIVDRETTVFASMVYPAEVKEVTAEDGSVVKVNYTWKDHTKESFMFTAVDDNGGQLGMTPIGVKAAQVLSALLNLHKQNIEKGIAKSQEDINGERVFRA